jgi:hypothetical protein
MMVQGFLRVPGNKLNYSHMEANINMIILMEYEGSNKYVRKSTLG